MSVLARNTDLGKKFSQKRFWDRFSWIWERIWNRYCTSSASHYEIEKWFIEKPPFVWYGCFLVNFIIPWKEALCMYQMGTILKC